MKHDRTILITGAPGEVAMSVASHVADVNDARVLVVSRRRLKSSATKNVEWLSGVDLDDYGSVQKLFRRPDLRASKRLGLVLGAGHFPEFPEVVADTQRATVNAMRDNFMTFANCLHAAIPIMRRHHYGRVVGFTSLTQSLSYPFSAGFNAAKAACESFAASVANENSRFGITVNMLALSTVNTKQERRLKPQGDRDSWLSPGEVAQYVSWLVSMEEPTLTGACLPLYRHSPTFFGEGYLKRIARKMPCPKP